MGETLDDFRFRRTDTRTIVFAVGVSMLLHILALLELRPLVHHPSPDADKLGAGRGPLTVQIVPPPVARTPPPRRSPAPHVERQPPTPRQQPPKTAAPAPRRAVPPVIALDKPAPAAPPPSVAKPPARAPTEQDFSSDIEARRRARSGPAPAPSLAFPDARPQAEPAEDANARANRLAAANLAPGNAPTFGYDPNRGGGIFSIRHVAYDYAEFMFYGWNTDAQRNTAQLIEVRKGSNPDIKVAVVRKMIAIIREHEQGEFLWGSRRLGRYVTLSARARDNDKLEEFMLAEFFDEMRNVR